MSVHLVGGGWRPEGDLDVTGSFLAEAAAHAVAAGRSVPRILMLFVVFDGTPSEAYRAGYPRSFAAVAPCELVTCVGTGAGFEPSVLEGVDGLVVGGGHTPSYLEGLRSLASEIRRLVADGLPYLGFSAGAMIASSRAIVGGRNIAGVQVCPDDADQGLDEVTVADGLGLVDFAVEVHAAQWGTLGRLVAATEAGRVEGGFAIDEHTVLVCDRRSLRRFGTGQVWCVQRELGGVVVRRPDLES